MWEVVERSLFIFDFPLLASWSVNHRIGALSAFFRAKILTCSVLLIVNLVH